MARPNLSYLKNAILVVVGVPCGILTGLTGLTNSFIVMPLLGWLLGLKDVRLGGSVLAVTSFSALTGILAYAQYHAVDPAVTVYVAIGFLAGAALAERAGASSPRLVGVTRPVGVVIGVVVGIAMILESLGKVHIDLHAYSSFRGHVWPVAMFVLGIAAGVFGRIFDLAGLLIAPAMYFLAGTTMMEAQGTSIAILLVSSVIPAVAYASRNLTEPRSSVWVSFGALFGALAGSQAAAHHSDHQLLMVYGTVMLVLMLVHALYRFADDDEEAG